MDGGWWKQADRPAGEHGGSSTAGLKLQAVSDGLSPRLGQEARLARLFADREKVAAPQPSTLDQVRDFGPSPRSCRMRSRSAFSASYSRSASTRASS